MQRVNIEFLSSGMTSLLSTERHHMSPYPKGSSRQTISSPTPRILHTSDAEILDGGSNPLTFDKSPTETANAVLHSQNMSYTHCTAHRVLPVRTRNSHPPCPSRHVADMHKTADLKQRGCTRVKGEESGDGNFTAKLQKSELNARLSRPHLQPKQSTPPLLRTPLPSPPPVQPLNRPTIRPQSDNPRFRLIRREQRNRTNSQTPSRKGMTPSRSLLRTTAQPMAAAEHPHQLDAPTTPSTEKPRLSANSSIESIIHSLPSTGLFSRYDGTPVSDSFPLYLPSQADLWARTTIPTEKTRCLIHALRAKPTASRKRPLDSSGPTSKRRRWSSLDRDRKTACLRTALAAATSGDVQDPVLKRLKKGWSTDPKKKQLVNAEVRQAICRSLQRWSMPQLREYVEKAGMEVRGQAKHDFVHAVHQHLAPDKEGERKTTRG